jgi:hypothetical protein
MLQVMEQANNHVAESTVFYLISIPYDYIHNVPLHPSITTVQSEELYFPAYNQNQKLVSYNIDFTYL